MTKVYFIRHCESVANRDGIIQGTKDFDISPLGEHQLVFLKKRFENIHLDKIYTSPLTRTRKTAFAVQGGRDIEIEVSPGFIEFDFGRCQGLTHSQMEKKYPETYWCFKNAFHEISPPGGIKFTEFYETVWKTTLETVARNPGKTIAVTSHGGTIRTIMLHILGYDISRYDEIPRAVNTAVFEVDFLDDGTFDVKTVNDDSHLDKKAAVRLEI